MAIGQISYQNQSTGNLEAQTGISGSANMINTAIEPGHDSTFNRTWGGGMAKSVSLTADGQIGIAGPCIYYGCIVTSALGAGVINIRDATAAGTGTIVDIVAASAAAGIEKARPFGVYCANGAYADFASTGTVTFFYQQL